MLLFIMPRVRGVHTDRGLEEEVQIPAHPVGFSSIPI
jgi:hypothetical protein